MLPASEVHIHIGGTRLDACSSAAKSVPAEDLHVDLNPHGAHPYNDPRQKHRPEG